MGNSTPEMPRHDGHTRCLEMPIFHGHNPDGWTFRVERFFAINRLSEVEKLEAAAVCLDGDALAWFQWEEGHRPFCRWSEFKTMILEGFLQSREGSVCERLLALRQDGTVREYRRQFEMLATHMTDIPDSVLEGSFVNGLKQEIRAEVLMMQPNGLARIMDLAQRVEDRNTTLKLTKGWSSAMASRSPATILPISSKTTPFSPSRYQGLPEKAPGQAGSSAFKKLTDSDLRVKREKGLCYRCDEKYTIGHRCKNQELQVLVLCDEADDTRAETDEKDEGISQQVEEIYRHTQ